MQAMRSFKLCILDFLVSACTEHRVQGGLEANPSRVVVVVGVLRRQGALTELQQVMSSTVLLGGCIVGIGWQWLDGRRGCAQMCGWTLDATVLVRVRHELLACTACIYCLHALPSCTAALYYAGTAPV